MLEWMSLWKVINLPVCLFVFPLSPVWQLVEKIILVGRNMCPIGYQRAKWGSWVALNLSDIINWLLNSIDYATFQWMEIGLIGIPGVAVQKHVKQEVDKEQEVALIQFRALTGRTVLDHLLMYRNVLCNHVPVNASNQCMEFIPRRTVRTETYLRSQSGNGPLVDRSSPIKNLCSTGLL